MEHQDGTFQSHLQEKKGVAQPPTTNNAAVLKFKHTKNRKKSLTVQEYVDGILEGNITILSQAITLVESNLPSHQSIAQEIIHACMPRSGNSIRIGITGVPGAGKSTFIESFGKIITANKHKLAVLAIDPSSERTKGSILGDKTRMELLSIDPLAYIRPSPSAGSLGGVARKTRESIILCEAAGFDVIFVETVGVGQSETAVHSMVDFFLLLMLAGAGDQLQGIKRGIMEMADSIAITKADGENTLKAEAAKIEYSSALHLFPNHPSGMNPKVFACSSIEQTGLTAIWQHIQDYIQHAQENAYFKHKRYSQASYWMDETMYDFLKQSFNSHPLVAAQMEAYREQVMQGHVSPFKAAQDLLDAYSTHTQ